MQLILTELTRYYSQSIPDAVESGDSDNKMIKLKKSIDADVEEIRYNLANISEVSKYIEYLYF